MRMRFVLAVASVGVATAVAAPAVSAQTPGEDSVTGRATSCDLDIVRFECLRYTFVDVDARSGPSGQNPAGTAEWESLRGTNLFLGDEGPLAALR